MKDPKDLVLPISFELALYFWQSINVVEKSY